jgi:hypothetical protein
LFLYDVFKVIYSPVKAFREVLENPRYFGPVIIIVISLFLTIGTQYVSVSKHYVETITPTSRVYWTNATPPSPSLWTLNAAPADLTAVPNNSSALLAGNYSVRALVSNKTEIWLKITTNGTINCSGSSGFKTLYYKLMYTCTLPQPISNATLRLYSFKNESNYFKFNLNSTRYLNSSGSWIDANVTLGEKALNWTVGSGSPSWSNITGIEFRLEFPNNGTMSLLLNDLYFGGRYEALLNVFGFSYWLSSTVMSSVFDILLRWLIFAGLLWLTVRVFQPQGSSFRTLLIVVGYAFAIMFVYVTIDMLSISQLPLLYFPNKVIFPLTGREIQNASIATNNIYNAYWTPTIAYDAFIGAWYVSHVWTIGLFAIAMRTLQNISWKKALLISIIAYTIALFVRSIIPL